MHSGEIDEFRRPGLLSGAVVIGRFSPSIPILRMGFRAKLFREELTSKGREGRLT